MRDFPRMAASSTPAFLTLDWPLWVDQRRPDEQSQRRQAAFQVERPDSRHPRSALDDPIQSFGMAVWLPHCCHSTTLSSGRSRPRDGKPSTTVRDMPIEGNGCVPSRTRRAQTAPYNKYAIPACRFARPQSKMRIWDSVPDGLRLRPHRPQNRRTPSLRRRVRCPDYLGALWSPAYWQVVPAHGRLCPLRRVVQRPHACNPGR